VLSGGERARLALACLLLRPFNLLVLDEPTNHLDMLSKDVLKQALLDFDGTLIVVSHDREFLRGLTNRTVEFRDRHLHEYIGDVDAFLEKRSLDNMRQVELSSKIPAAAAPPPKREISYEERKRLQRNVSQAEKRIEKLEEELAKLEQVMGDLSFYERPDAQQVTKDYQQKKSALEEAMSEWEEAQSTLDEAGI